MNKLNAHGGLCVGQKAAAATGALTCKQGGVSLSTSSYPVVRPMKMQLFTFYNLPANVWPVSVDKVKSMTKKN